MFFTCLNALAAIWLFTTPLIWPELPARGVLAAVAGMAAIVLGILAIASRRARIALVVLGSGLGVVNFFLPGDIGIMTSFVTSALLIMLGGLSPVPQVVQTAAATVNPAAPEEGAAAWPERAAA
jgi:hypothetical protein